MVFWKHNAALTKLALLGMLLILPACETIRITDAGCQATRTISFAWETDAQGQRIAEVSDTRETVAEIRGHNAAWRAACLP